MVPARAIERSFDRKLSSDGTVSATYVSQNSCPATCPFRNAGCYAESGHTAFTTRKVNASEVVTPESIAEVEAGAIRGLSGQYPLRLHVVGDCSTEAAARIVAEAADEYASRHDMPVWTYTHAHDVPRNAWGKVSVLRSCENLTQISQAHADGYATAMVVPEFESDKAYPLENGFVGIPCPHQTGKVKGCKNCGLCQNDEKLHANKRVVLFAAHGSRKKMVAASAAALASN